MRVKEENVVPRHLGNGIIVFNDVLDIDQDFLIPYLAELHEKVVEEEFTIIHGENNEKLYAVNRSGHRYSIDDIYKVNRIMGFATNDKESETYKFFLSCEDAIYACLLRYVEQFPMILPSLWWKEQGHVAAYKPDSAMGFHSDNDVNYRPGEVPDMQLATRHVVGALLYFNDSVDSVDQIQKYEYIGGELDFKYLDVTYKPKTGDVIMFPSNYMATHEVRPLHSGSRYVYISYFSHGSADIQRGIGPAEKLDTLSSGQVWIPSVFKDYHAYIKNKYGDDLINHPHLTLPLERVSSSSGTTEEVQREKRKNDKQ
jgi:hypothetical protein